MENLQQFREKVRNDLKHYYLTNDKAHQIDHADKVCDLALALVDKLSTDPDYSRMAIVAAYCHDMFSKRDKEFRRDHHERAFEFVMSANVEWLESFTRDQIILIALACREHRASWDMGYSSDLSEIIAAADRGMPDIDDYLYRAYLYSVDSLGLPHQESIVRSILHINDKHGENGTVYVPDLWKKIYAEELADIRATLSALRAVITPMHGIIVHPSEGKFLCFISVNARLPIEGGENLANALKNGILKTNYGGKFSSVVREHWFVAHG